MQGGCENNLKVEGMPERVQKTKCRGCCGKILRGGCRRGYRRQNARGVVLREKFEGGGYAGEGKEDEMRGGLAGKNWGGGG